MRTFICNICERRLEGGAFEFSMISGRPVADAQGTTRIAHRSQVRVLHLCDRCGQWLDLGIRSVGESLAAANAVREDPRWLQPTPQFSIDVPDADVSIDNPDSEEGLASR